MNSTLSQISSRVKTHGRGSNSECNAKWSGCNSRIHLRLVWETSSISRRGGNGGGWAAGPEAHSGTVPGAPDSDPVWTELGSERAGSESGAPTTLGSWRAVPGCSGGAG